MLTVFGNCQLLQYSAIHGLNNSADLYFFSEQTDRELGTRPTVPARQILHDKYLELLIEPDFQETTENFQTAPILTELAPGPATPLVLALKR